MTQQKTRPGVSHRIPLSSLSLSPSVGTEVGLARPWPHPTVTLPMGLSADNMLYVPRQVHAYIYLYLYIYIYIYIYIHIYNYNRDMERYIYASQRPTQQRGFNVFFSPLMPKSYFDITSILFNFHF